MINLPKLTAEQIEKLQEDIQTAKLLLDNLPTYERAGIDITDYRRGLLETIEQNEKMLRELSN